MLLCKGFHTQIAISVSDHLMGNHLHEECSAACRWFRAGFEVRTSGSRRKTFDLWKEKSCLESQPSRYLTGVSQLRCS